MSSAPARAKSWTDEEILCALGEWEWAPEGTEVINTDDCRILFRPEKHGRMANVSRVTADRPGPMIIQEINALARVRDFDTVSWSIYPTTMPPSLSDDLLAAGGTISDEGALMSLRVPDDGLLDVGPIDDIEVRRVRDVNALTDYRTIISTVYEQRMSTAADITQEAAGIPQDKLGCRFVAYIDGQPAGTGALAIRGDGSASLFVQPPIQSIEGAASTEPSWQRVRNGHVRTKSRSCWRAVGWPRRRRS